MRSRHVWCGWVIAIAACGDDTNGTNTAGTLDPADIPKFVQPLFIPPAMAPVTVTADRDEYVVAMRQLEQQVLPAPLPATTLWGYGNPNDPASFSSPGPTFETRSFRPVRVTWRNELVDAGGAFLQHLLPVDQTIHWADPSGATTTGHDHGGDASLAQPYTGPVPTVVHVHGAHSFAHSDGFPEAWWLPGATNIPEGFAMTGPAYATQADAGAGGAVFDYPQDEDAATLWYHDHTIGMTRVNIYAGLAGYWLIRDDIEDALALPGPAPRVGDPAGTAYYEIPLVIQDRSFNRDGSLFYPGSRSDYDQYPGPVFPDSDVAPIWGPEFIGDAMVVNGRAWPFLEVEPRLYRFRILNASDARTLMLELDRAGLPFVKIGVDGGRMSGAPVRQTQLLMGPAERVDVLVDFSGLAVGEVVTMTNVGPDDPWGGPDADPPQDPADPSTTGQVMQFRVVSATGAGAPGAIPASLPVLADLQPTAPTRDLLLQETETPDGMYPVHVQLGTLAMGPLPWTAPATEVVKLDSTEIWRVTNVTDDAHPIHIHLVDFQIIDRQPFDSDAFKTAHDAYLAGTAAAPVLEDYFTGPPDPIDATEDGPKDTVIMLPGTVTRIIAKFDRAGTYVWHCHIIEHEDNDMMRPLVIAP